MRILAVLMGLAVTLNFAISSASAALLIKVNKSTQTLTVIRDGATLHTWPVSTGRTGHTTPSGTFTAFRMEAEHFSKEWDDAPMPHSVFFTKQGHAIHGSYDVKHLGLPASHGCVRLAPRNATKLFALVKQEGLSNTRVVLNGSEQVALVHKKSLRIANSVRLGGDSRQRTTEPSDKEYGTRPSQNSTQSYAASTSGPGSLPQDYWPSGDDFQPLPYIQRGNPDGRF
jgi:hypothetical protein